MHFANFVCHTRCNYIFLCVLQSIKMYSGTCM